MTTREELVDRLADCAGPLGPFRTPEQRQSDCDAWHARLLVEDLPALLDIAAVPPPESAYRPATWDEFELELIDAMAACGKRSPGQALDAVGAFLANPRARPTAITVIGVLGLAESLPLLATLIPHSLTVDELVRLACALGDIGTDPARGLLEQLVSLPGADNADVQSEMAIARGRLLRSK